MAFWNLGLGSEPKQQQRPRRRLLVHYVYGKGDVRAFPGVRVRRRLSHPASEDEAREAAWEALVAEARRLHFAEAMATRKRRRRLVSTSSVLETLDADEK